jgi:hypothetical protein
MVWLCLRNDIKKLADVYYNWTILVHCYQTYQETETLVEPHNIIFAVYEAISELTVAQLKLSSNYIGIYVVVESSKFIPRQGKFLS